MPGFEEIKANIAKLAARLEVETAAAADESAKYLEGLAKQIAPWTDRTGNLRNSILGQSGVGTGGVLIVLSESMSYAPYVEAGHFAKRGTSRFSTRAGRATSQRLSDRAYGTAVQPRAALWPAVVQGTPVVLEILRSRVRLGL